MPARRSATKARQQPPVLDEARPALDAMNANSRAALVARLLRRLLAMRLGSLARRAQPQQRP